MSPTATIEPPPQGPAMAPGRKLGIFYAAFAACTWGTVFVLSKWLTSTGELPVCTLAFWRFAFCCVFLFAMLAATGRAAKPIRAVAQHPLRFGLMGLLGGYAMYLLVLLSLRYTMTNTTQIVMNSNAVFIAPLALLIGERMGRRGLVGLGLGLAGCVIVVAGSGSAEPSGKDYHHVLGGSLAVLAGLSWAGYTVVGREVIRRHGGLECTAGAMAVGLALLAVTVPATGSPFHISRQQLLPVLYLGLVPTALGFAAWFKAMEVLPANVVGPFQFLQPVIGVSLAVCFLGERLTPLIILGGLTAFAGVYFTTAEPAPKTPAQGNGETTR